MTNPIPVIDLFAGAGGLGEGFTSLEHDGQPCFRTVMAVEKDTAAHQTLLFRAFLWKLYRKNNPQVIEDIKETFLDIAFRGDQAASVLENKYPSLWAEAQTEVLCAELEHGDMTLIEEGRKRLEAAGSGVGGDWVLIGGPPCQAYSGARRHTASSDPEAFESDPRQVLYKCYMDFVRELKPAMFVMENVVGLLSVKRSGVRVFDTILKEMTGLGYEVRSVVKEAVEESRDYVVEAEKFGIPQSRHRVILLGVRQGSGLKTGLLAEQPTVTVRDAIGDLDRVRSQCVGEKLTAQTTGKWEEALCETSVKLASSAEGKDLLAGVIRAASRRGAKHLLVHTCFTRRLGDRVDGPLSRWYMGRMRTICERGGEFAFGHEGRSHSAGDLGRYLYYSLYGEQYGVSPKIMDIPEWLLPAHKNLKNVDRGRVAFADRYRVQVWDKPSTTIVAHIAKDGNGYIHPDPAQCRSLTVREAARLQTFPDDYVFFGGRTNSYKQIGNAVPPLLAWQIAGLIAHSFSLKDLEHKEVGSIDECE